MKATAKILEALTEAGHTPSVASAGGPPSPGDANHTVYVCDCGHKTSRPFGEAWSWDTFLRRHLAAVQREANRPAG